MYAIIRTGGKQTKVRQGDLIDVERLRVQGEVSFTPLLVVDDAGTVFSARDELKTAKVVARVVGETAGPKVDLFKYKAKTGYRHRQGHRQRYTTLEVTRIDLPARVRPVAGDSEEGAAPTAVETAAPVADIAQPPATAPKAAKAAKPAVKEATAETAGKPSTARTARAAKAGGAAEAAGKRVKPAAKPETKASPARGAKKAPTRKKES